MPILDAGPSSSPTRAPVIGSRTLDAPPSRPPDQRRGQSVLFTPPADENAGMGEMGGDPMVQDMAASAAVDKSIQTLAKNHPEAVDALAEFQQMFRGLITNLMTQQTQGPGMGAPNVVPPLPMQSGPSAGMQQGPGL